MARLQVIHIASIAELRCRGRVRWDDLWWRSNVALPTLRAGDDRPVDGAFRPEAPFHAIAVEDAGRWVAALPLVGRPAAGVLPAGWTVGNPWSTAADLLWDSSWIGDVETGAALVEAAGSLPWPLLWLEGIPLESPQWQAMRRGPAPRGNADRLPLRLEHGANRTRRRLAGAAETMVAASTAARCTAAWSASPRTAK